MAQEKKNSTVARFAGLGVVGVGVAHFVRPQLFESITKSAFPRDTRRHIYTNGGIETALGLALSAPRTRRLGAVGTVAYLTYLAGNAARNR